jgi:hypothetical protein
MLSRNLIIFSVISAILVFAVIIGRGGAHRSPAQRSAVVSDSIPDIGPVQVLNGCGQTDAGDKMADFLRSRKFDVKSIGNAKSANYPFTMVIGRKKDMKTARQIEAVLHTGHCILLCNGEPGFEAAVILGPDFQSRIP